MTAKLSVIQAQLTLRAVVWDIPDRAGIGADRLWQEMECYRICRIDVSEDATKYPMALKRLKAVGISEREALLVTQDAGMARRCKDSGIAVVFYERAEVQAEVSADLIVLGFEEIGVQFLDRVQKRRNGLPWNILYTERTCVREITLEDLDELYAIYEEEGMTDFTEPLFDREQEEEYTRSYIRYMYYYYGYGMWVIQDRQSKKLLGRAGIERRTTQTGAVVMELGYLIRTQEQGKGYALEVCQAILDYARQELELDELHCFIHPKNQASIRLAEKLGFVWCADTDAAQDGWLDFKKYMHTFPNPVIG